MQQKDQFCQTGPRSSCYMQTRLHRVLRQAIDPMLESHKWGKGLPDGSYVKFPASRLKPMRMVKKVPPRSALTGGKAYLISFSICRHPTANCTSTGQWKNVISTVDYTLIVCPWQGFARACAKQTRQMTFILSL